MTLDVAAARQRYTKSITIFTSDGFEGAEF
jgi:hypothetical protein